METLSQLPSHVSTWWMHLSSPALETVRLALSPAYEWVLTYPLLAAFAAGWTLFCFAMLYAFIKADARPTLNQRCAAEVEEARR
ncbi:hypothetical protein [Nocardiopsis sp. NRRL B-16309]|uniref:hypothetical protein n=1 Tax=Nocardiopsis sp. NRRL B-16309 TaxID=1519494 RepID=UPI0006ADF1E1|nr:hypothetical protein [Nocardiopsis sp. NRRL B-16309]KOX10103.1 hypothetical protein ADL05_25810 [Nocardiopsis sp. NRRL B-16309]